MHTIFSLKDDPGLTYTADYWNHKLQLLRHPEGDGTGKLTVLPGAWRMRPSYHRMPKGPYPPPFIFYLAKRNFPPFTGSPPMKSDIFMRVTRFLSMKFKPKDPSLRNALAMIMQEGKHCRQSLKQDIGFQQSWKNAVNTPLPAAPWRQDLISVILKWEKERR